jgi:hypothetical protein
MLGQLLEAPNPRAKFRILEDVLLARWRGPLYHPRAVVLMGAILGAWR